MGLYLSTRDVVELQKAIRVLSSPLDYEDVDDWRREVNDALRALTGAEKALFKLPAAVHEGARIGFSDEHDECAFPDYQAYYAEKDLGLQRVLERRMEIFSRDELFPEDRDRLLESECYNDFLLPHGVGDSLGMFEVPVDSSAAAVWVHHSESQGANFSRRGTALMHLLAPAFRTGVAIRTRFARLRHSLASMLDQMEHGLALFDLEGRRLHYNRRLREMLAAMQCDRLERRIRRAARRAGRILVSDTSLDRELRGTRYDEPISEAEHEVRATHVDEALGIPGGGIVVSVDPAEPRLPSVEELRERFRLTAREAEVAMHIAARKTNGEIATELIISPHTARRHTERVLAKLGVRSRFEVAERLQERARAG